MDDYTPIKMLPLPRWKKWLARYYIWRIVRSHKSDEMGFWYYLGLSALILGWGACVVAIFVPEIFGA